MERAFVPPHDADAQRARVTLSAPYDHTFEERREAADSAVTHRYTDHAAAIDGYLARIDELLDEGYRELPPFIVYRKGKSTTVALRPPIIPELTVIVDGETATETFDALPDAVRAYNTRLDTLLADKFRVVRPTFTGLYPRPGGEFETVTVHEDDSKTVCKRHYRHKDDHDSEFGPEWWYRDGKIHSHNFQMHTQRQGPTVEYSQAGFRAVGLFHRGVRRGASVFSVDGDSERISDVTVYEADTGTSQARSLALTMSGDAIDTWTETGVDGNGDKRGVWRVWAGAREVETGYDPPGNVSWRRIYKGPERRLIGTQSYDAHGEKHGDWETFDEDGERIEHQHYEHGAKVGHWRQRQDGDDGFVEYHFRQPDVYARIAWFYPDGTPEQTRVFGEDGAATLLELHRADGSLSQRRTRDGDGWLAEHYGDDGTTVERLELLDSDGNRVKDLPLDGGPAEDAWLKDLFATLERGAYLPVPAEPQRSSLYGPTTAGALNLAQTLEDHLARLFCIAFDVDLDELKPDGAKARGAWTHTSKSGAKLVLARKKGELARARLYHPDGRLAAEATWLRGPAVDRSRLAVTLLHDDGESPRRHGEYRTEYPWNARDTLHLTRDGWWLDVGDTGTAERAQYFSSGSTNLLADHRYESPPTHDDDAPRSFDALLDEARSLASGEASRAHFVALCRLVERAAARDMHRTVRELVPVVHDRVATWPSRLRAAPLLWINRLVRGELPVQALHLVSGLSLSAAITSHYLHSPHYPLLVDWLRRYPADGPTIEGLSMSLCRAQVDALREARDAEPDARLHPDGDLDYNVDETFHRDSSDNPVIFGSPLLRELRVLDASIDPTRHDFDWDYQGILDGRGLTLSTVLGNVASTQLVAVDLHGQSIEARDPLGLERPNKAVRERVATLTHLDVGGGHPLGDAALRQLARRCPAIERLSLSPGPAGDVLTDHDFDEWEEGEGRDSVYGRLHEHWRIYGNEDIEHMRASSAGWRALGKLEHLERLIVGSMHDASPVGTDVEIVVDDGWAPASRLALWQQWFDA